MFGSKNVGGSTPGTSRPPRYPVLSARFMSNGAARAEALPLQILQILRFLLLRQFRGCSLTSSLAHCFTAFCPIATDKHACRNRARAQCVPVRAD